MSLVDDLMASWNASHPDQPLRRGRPPERPLSALVIVARSEPPRCPKGTHTYDAENAGRCLTRYTCRTCGKVKIIDSGD